MSHASTFFDLNQEISLSAGHDRTVVFARRVSGGLAHVDEVDNGKACECVCLACNEALIARQGDVRGHSFAHRSGTQCTHAMEAMLHGVAVELIARRGQFVTPALAVEAFVPGPYGRLADSRQLPAMALPVDAVMLEQRPPWPRPSIVATIKGRPLLIHIALDHPASEHQRQTLSELGRAGVEIDLTKHIPHSVAELEQILTSADRRKTWLFNPREAGLRAEIQAALQPKADAQWHQHDQAVKARQALREHLEIERAERARQHAAALAVERERLNQRPTCAARAPTPTTRLLAEAAEPAAPPRPGPQKPEELSPSAEYGSALGRLWLLHSSRPDVHFKAEAGMERVVGVLERHGAVHGPADDVYRISREGWARAAIELGQTWTTIRSV